MNNEKSGYSVNLPSWLVAVALAVLAFAFAYVLIVQPKRFEFAGLGFGVAPEFDLSANGAVIAFDRKDSDEHGECPNGWDIFKPAVGRMIIGADTVTKKGEPENARLLLPSYAEDERAAVGGGVKHTLTAEEMPKHDHEVSGDPNGSHFYVLRMKGGNNTSPANGALTEGQPSGLNFFGSTSLPSAGGDQPHNNMLPYIALYFCKKEG